MFTHTPNLWSEDNVYKMQSFNPKIGVRNMFVEFDQHFQSKKPSNFIELEDEENQPDIETRYSTDYNNMTEEFGNHTFHIMEKLKY